VKKWFIAGLAAMLALTVFNVAYGARTIKLVIKGEQMSPDVPVQAINGRIFVPLRLIAEQLNEGVRWDAKTGTVLVAPDLWEQDLAREMPRSDWVEARNVILRFLMAYDERDDAGRELNWSARISTRISSGRRLSFRCRRSASTTGPWSISSSSTRNGTGRPKS